MEVAIIGSGYVGLVSGVCLAEFGHHVSCIDIDQDKLQQLRAGKSPIYEPGLTELLQKNLAAGRLHFTDDFAGPIAKAEVVFIAVGTPSCRRGSGYADLAYVYEAARTLAPHLTGFTVVVNKSTVPMGTARQVQRLIAEANPQAQFSVASNPEFLREGAAIYDFMHPDRVVLGCMDEQAAALLRTVYQPLSALKSPLLVTDPETAELIKYSANAFLATKISFINEMANLCEAVGANVQDLAYGLGLDERIGAKFLQAGPGYGGSCFPKDTTALIRMAQEHGAPARIVETVVEVNNAQKARMVGKIRDALADLPTPTLAVLGLTFKPQTDDMRDAPALTILPALLSRGVQIRVHDPVGMEEARKLLPELTYCSDPYEACQGADAVCLLTEWELYQQLDLNRIRHALKQAIFIDLRNVYAVEAMRAAGFRYISIGRRDVTP